MMEGYVVSISNNKIRISLLGDDQVFETELPEGAVDGTRISDPDIVAENLGSLILTGYGEKPKKAPLNFSVEPEDTMLGFITNTKEEFSERFFEESCAKQLAKYALSPEEAYYSYKKIAPFVYQFIAVKKSEIEKYLKIANDLGFELDSVIPWVALLPKYVSNSGEPKIFLTNEGDGSVLALSELNGIYHVGNLDEEGSRLKSMLHDLSVYERNNPIKKVYTMGFDDMKMGDEFEITPLDVGGVHDLFGKTLDGNIITSQANLLNLLPVPEVNKSKVPAVVAGVVVALILIGVGAYFGIQKMDTSDENNLASNPESNVLSENEESQQSQDENGNENGQEESEQTEQDETLNMDLNREYLKVRVENGTIVPGLAGRTRDLLGGLGYEIISIGDSSSSDVEAVKLSFTKDTFIYKDILTEDLKEMYQEVTVDDELASDLGYDVLVTAGDKLVE